MVCYGIFWSGQLLVDCIELGESESWQAQNK